MVSDIQKDLSARLSLADIERQTVGYISSTHVRALAREATPKEGVDRIIKETRQALESGTMKPEHGDVMIKLLEKHGEDPQEYANAVAQSELRGLYEKSLHDTITLFRGGTPAGYPPQPSINTKQTVQNIFQDESHLRGSIQEYHALAISGASSPEEGIKNLIAQTDLAVSQNMISEEQGIDIKNAIQQSGTDSKVFATAVLNSKDGMAFLTQLHARERLPAPQEATAAPEPSQPQEYGPPVPPELISAEPEEVQLPPEGFVGPLTAEQQALKDSQTQQSRTSQDLQNLNLQEMGPGGILVALLTMLFNPNGENGMDFNNIISQIMGAFGLGEHTVVSLEDIPETSSEEAPAAEEYDPPAPEEPEQPEPEEHASNEAEMNGPPVAAAAPEEEAPANGEITTFVVDNVPNTGIPIIDFAAEKAASFIGGLGLGDVFSLNANPDPNNVREVDSRVDHAAEAALEEARAAEMRRQMHVVSDENTNTRTYGMSA
ncbi:MAG: hypothetical protein GC137_04785 [Alphaproteobacteria bacterium]|nr:hypothetical protein [Alphaproteobacteria bacterium]